jgi:hypothetical protein
MISSGQYRRISWWFRRPRMRNVPEIAAKYACKISTIPSIPSLTVDSVRARLEIVGASFAKRSKLTRSLMSACRFGKISAASAERGTSEGKPSRDRAISSLFDRPSTTQLARATVGQCGGSIAKARVRTRQKRENRTRYLSAPTTKRVLTTTWVRCRRRLRPVRHAFGTPLWS